MSKSEVDLVGKRYGYLTVTEKAEDFKRDSHELYWKCLCDCGNTLYVSTGKLNAGRVKSCNNQCSKLLAENPEMCIIYR